MPSTLSLHDYDLTLRDINAICREALNRDRLSFDSDFFALGADSLTLVEIQLLIEDKFGIAVDWRDILRCRSVSSLAYFLCSRDYQDAQPHKQAAFNGVTFCYRVIGSLNANSVPKLIIGGGFQDMYSLPHLESLLASDGPLIFVDVPGTGAADDIPENAGFAFLAACINKILEIETLAEVDLIGISYGGLIALEFSYQWPEKIAHMILVGVAETHPLAVKAKLDHALSLLRSGAREQAAVEIVESLMCMDATKEVQLRDELYKLLKTALMSYAEIQQSRFEALRKRMTERKPRTAPVKLDAPTLFVTGEHDSITLAEDIAACAALFETATFYTITEADHLVFIERPTELAEVIIRFVHGIDFTQAPYLKQYHRLDEAALA
ncbi:alpha/beta fold hydrolase [Brucella pseudogrignonensis]|jgi:pimeloyl-ACP methyl ester carboxylesterase/acyl carrier protein|uniref:alpha/beta fold hydrolase n=1 Tax=Brucella pseudogrignonensis TaxID=419475 RepID=UPI0038D02FD2